MAPERDRVRDADRPLARALARPLGALLDAANAVLAATLRALGKGDGETSDGSTPPPLRAIPGGAAARARRRADLARVDVAPSDDDGLADVGMDVGDEDDDADTLLVLPRDPRTIFVTWRRSAATDVHRAQRIAATLDVVRDALSIEVDVLLADEGDPGATWTVILPPLAESAYVDLERPRNVARVTLGTCGDEDGFVALSQPVVVRLPEEGPAPHRAPSWRAVEGANAGLASAPPEPSREIADRLHARALAQREPAADEAPPASDVSTPASPAPR